MNEVQFSKTSIIKYLVFTFGSAWIFQVCAFFLYRNNLMLFGQLVIALTMFFPLLGTLVSGNKLKGMGWMPRFKGNILMLLTAWFSPIVFTALGALLYFALFPSHFDLSGSYLIEAAGEDAVRQMNEQGIDFQKYLLIITASCLTNAPFINMFLAVGEETGWRGFLYPQLKARFGRIPGLTIGGIIWSCWHWPLIWLTGYEYGTDYVGFPLVGMLLFCIFCIFCGIICDVIYEKSKSIWFPALFHGSTNAACSLPLVICITNAPTNSSLLGPIPNGLISCIPMVLFAIMLMIINGKKKAEGLTP